jgi:RimJ/RimL family protein N-acetyltransferase
MALSTKRLTLGSWTEADASAGLRIFGQDEVTRWLVPAMDAIQDEAQMRILIEQWVRDDAGAEPPLGHWAVRRRTDDALVGSITVRVLPPFQEDLELAWQFAPQEWGHGYATEAARGVAAWAFEGAAHELFAVMRSANAQSQRLAQRLGMQWVGETDKYYDRRLQVFRLRPPDLLAAPE